MLVSVIQNRNLGMGKTVHLPIKAGANALFGSVHSCHNGSVRSGGGPGARRRSVYFLTAAAAVAKV